MVPCPKIDRRSAEDLAAQVRTLLSFYVPGLQGAGEVGKLPDAMVRIFARYGEIVIDRLNRAPQKNFLAFLDLIGISPDPPRSARVPLTFYLSAPQAGYTVVPAGTQVAAELAKGEQKPVLFETEHELVVTAVRLESLLLKDAARDRYRDWKSVLGPAVSPASGAAPSVSKDASAGDPLAIPHMMYIALPAGLHWPEANRLSLRFQLEESVQAFLDKRSLQWELCETAANVAEGSEKASAASELADADKAFRSKTIVPERDETKNLAKSGEITFRNLPQVQPAMLEGMLAPWIRCCLLTSITRSAEAQNGAVRDFHLPRIKEINIESQFERTGTVPEAVFVNSLKVDTSKEFFPFGEKPKFGDTLYIASDAFSNPDASLTIHVELTNPARATDSPLPPVIAQSVKLLWEFWNGEQWVTLGTTSALSAIEPTDAPDGLLHRSPPRRVRFVDQSPPSPTPETPLSDTTQAFSASGNVSFRLNQPAVAATINGQKGNWIRARIIAGDYGREARYEWDAAKEKPVLHPASFAPPSIRAIRIDSSVKIESKPQTIITWNDFIYSQIREGETFSPFLPAATKDAGSFPTIYFGFTLPAAPNQIQALPRPLALPAFPNRNMSVYVGLNEKSHEEGQGSSDQPTPVANWEYWNGSTWTRCTVRDDTQGLTQSGLIRFLGPPDFQLKNEFGLSRYWLRMSNGTADFDPRLTTVLLNTTMAQEGATTLNEVLGTSNGRPSQSFRTIQSPILAGQQLEVREPSLPMRDEQSRIMQDEGKDAIRRIDISGSREQIWVRWHEVPNFYCSKPRDRHYVLDRVAGEVLFGDGVNGQIPPPMPGNIRMASYRSGGRAAGNKPAFAVKQLKTAVPFVDKVVNWEDAGGGGDAETIPSLLERGPRTLRHRHRAVTREDFEDLALLASPQVAKVKCVPLCDLQKDRDGAKRQAGVVSLIVAPRSADATPMPNTELLDCVRGRLLDSRLPTVRLVLVGPEYVAVDVEAEIAVDDVDTAAETELAVTSAIQSYLHPTAGGRAQTGWDFGRQPHKSDLCAVIEDVSGVSHVRQLQYRMRPLRQGSEKTGHFLICSGTHKIVTTLQE